MKKKSKHFKKHRKIKKKVLQVTTLFILLILSSAVGLNAQNLLSENMDSCDMLINSHNVQKDHATSVLGFDMQSLRNDGNQIKMIKKQMIQTKKSENTVSVGKDKGVVTFYSETHDVHNDLRYLSSIMNKEDVGYYMR
ncbi:hypothetical protein [uncultured Aquimarina sp.]|uniref:hypothetical protein n=1 Tax=uncultured Aquimarina sp. TaxID=575652 RepID=UPI00262797B1|nr:hypothetical protein [uncultured Aquimarina sp.]